VGPQWSQEHLGRIVRIDPAGFPFVVLACIPAFLSAFLGPLWLTAGLLVLPVGIGLFFRDPERVSPAVTGAVLSPADGKVMHAGPAVPAQSPPGSWLQVTIFLSLFDVHINRTPVPGRVHRVSYVPGTFKAAFKPDSHANEHSEIWIDHDGVIVVVRQVVGVLARRVVCRLKAGDEVATGQRIGLMKFGSRMDVFVPLSSTLMVKAGDRVTAGVSIIARLPARESK
jgi:phosphatidylserine decarboxylase